jgi:endo-alpha-1,4-polygalactosaminidase (GH114 family)
MISPSVATPALLLTIDDGAGRPIINRAAEYVSAPVNAGNPVWRSKMQRVAKEQMALGCTGLFLDTIDTATVERFAWTQEGMMKLLEDLHNITPNLLINRGIALLETKFANDYKKLSWAVMYEDFFTEWEEGKGVLLGDDEQEASVKYWAPMLAGKNVLVVDFANCEQLEKNAEVVAKQANAVATVKIKARPMWPNYMADITFKEIRYQFKYEK